MKQVRVSMDSIRINLCKMDYPSTDSFYDVPTWGFVDKDHFDKMMYFQNELPYGESEVEELIKDKMDKLGAFSMIYQFNARFRNQNDYVRMVVIINNGPGLREISWFDAYIKYPVLKVICKIYNN